MIRKTLIFFAAAIAAYVLAAMLASKSAMDSIVALGLPISISQRIGAFWHDLFGMATSLLPLIVIAYLIAFLVTGLLTRWWPNLRIVLYIAAGALAIVGIHIALNLTFEITPVAAARTTGGLLMQGVAGALGGYLFARFTQTGNPREKSISSVVE